MKKKYSGWNAEDDGGNEDTWKISLKTKENMERNNAARLGSVGNRGRITSGLTKM